MQEPFVIDNHLLMLLKKIQNSLLVQDSYVDKNGYLVLGDAGAGKSTLICQEIGIKINEKESNGVILYEADSPTECPAISHDLHRPQTLYAKGWASSDAQSSVYVDTPGFASFSNDLSISLNIELVTSRLKKIKGIIIVISENYIFTTRGDRNLVELLKKIAAFINPDNCGGKSNCPILFAITHLSEKRTLKNLVEQFNKICQEAEVVDAFNAIITGRSGTSSRTVCDYVSEKNLVLINPHANTGRQAIKDRLAAFNASDLYFTKENFIFSQNSERQEFESQLLVLAQQFLNHINKTTNACLELNKFTNSQKRIENALHQHAKFITSKIIYPSVEHYRDKIREEMLNKCRSGLFSPITLSSDSIATAISTLYKFEYKNPNDSTGLNKLAAPVLENIDLFLRESITAINELTRHKENLLKNEEKEWYMPANCNFKKTTGWMLCAYNAVDFNQTPRKIFGVRYKVNGDAHDVSGQSLVGHNPRHGIFFIIGHYIPWAILPIVTFTITGLQGAFAASAVAFAGAGYEYLWGSSNYKTGFYNMTIAPERGVFSADCYLKNENAAASVEFSVERRVTPSVFEKIADLNKKIKSIEECKSFMTSNRDEVKSINVRAKTINEIKRLQPNTTALISAFQTHKTDLNTLLAVKCYDNSKHCTDAFSLLNTTITKLSLTNKLTSFTCDNFVMDEVIDSNSKADLEKIEVLFPEEQENVQSHQAHISSGSLGEIKDSKTSSATRTVPFGFGVFKSFFGTIKSGIDSLYSLPKPQLRQDEAPKFQPGNNVPASTFLLPLSVNDYLGVVGPYVAHYVRELFPYTLSKNRMRDMTENEQIQIAAYRRRLLQLQNIFNLQNNSRAGRSGMFQDKINSLSTRLSFLNGLLIEVTETQKISDSVYKNLQKEFREINKKIKDLSTNNHQLKQIDKQLRTKMRRDVTRGNVSSSEQCVNITHNIITDQIGYRFVTYQELTEHQLVHENNKNVAQHSNHSLGFFGKSSLPPKNNKPLDSSRQPIISGPMI